MRVCILIPAFDAARTLAGVIEGVRELAPTFVIDDGSSDETTRVANGTRVIKHDYNRGKGAAIRSGMLVARDEGFDACVTVDADGQHPPAAVKQIVGTDAPEDALVLGIRDLERAGAPRANQISNGISNFFLSRFSGKKLADTQCGLRRYPIKKTLALKGRADRYAYEAEIVLRATYAKMPIVEVPIDVFYPPEHERVTHFDSVKDPARIVAAVVRTMIVR